MNATSRITSFGPRVTSKVRLTSFELPPIGATADETSAAAKPFSASMSRSTVRARRITL